MGNVFQRSGGGGGTTPALPAPPVPSTPLKSEHEANVEFAREFVVELVEKVPKREKETIVVKPVLKDDVISLKSASESSFQTLSSAAETVSLPDLLQPESVYKKQTDTDTDTAEYESAGDTDPLNSPIGSVLLEDVLNSFEEALNKKQHSETTGAQLENTNDSEIPTPSEVSELQDVCSTDAGAAEASIADQSTHSEVSTLSETYEDAKSFEKEVNCNVRPLNISDLCVQIDKLHLDSSTVSQKSSSDIPSDSLSPVAHGDCDTSGNFISEEELQKTEDQLVIEQLSGVQLNTSKQIEENFDIKEVAASDDSVVSSSNTEIKLDSSITIVPKKSEDANTVEEEVLSLKNVKNESISEVTVLADSSYIVADNSETEENRVEHADKESPLKDQVQVVQDSSNQKTPEVIDVNTDSVSSSVHAESSHTEKEFENEIKKFEESAVESLGIKDLNVEQSPDSTVSNCANANSNVLTNDLHTTDVLQVSSTSHAEEDTTVFDSLGSNSHAEEDTTVLNSLGEQTVTNVVSSEALKSPPEDSTPSKAKQKLTQEFANEPALQVKKEVGEKDNFASSALPDTTCEQTKCVTDLQAVLPLQNGALEKVEHIEKQESVTKEPPNELSELIALCSRQQKELELGDEKFVDGKEFFCSPSLNEFGENKSEKSHPENSLLSCVSDFDKSITEEAEKVLQDIINSSDIEVEEIKAASGESVMAETQEKGAGVVDETGVNPFVSKTGIKRSPPTSRKSPRQSQNQSPAASPRSKSRHSGSPARVISETNRSLSRDSSPRSQPSVLEKAGSGESSPKNSTINSEINHSEAGPDIAEDAPGGDVFKDPSAFEFLNSVGNSQRETDLRKESLYVKFDPLVGAVSKTGSAPLPAAVEAKSVNIQQAAQEVLSPVKEQHSDTPTNNPAISFIDKLISLSPSPLKSTEVSPIKQAVVAPVRQIVETPTKQEAVTPANLSDNRGNEHAEMLEELYLLRELLAKQDEHHKVEIANLRSQTAELQARLKEGEEREVKLNKKVVEKAQGQKQMSIIMEEYEKTISRLVAEKEQERHAHEIDKENIIKERDAAMGHLANIEIAFSDVHKKYERSKAVIEGFKKNEEVLRASLAEYEATIRKQEQKYEVLKSHAMAQLESANQELEAVRRSQQAETAKLKAMLKKAELKTSSLEEMLEQKVKENQELAAICDELINKVGSSD